MANAEEYNYNTGSTDSNMVCRTLRYFTYFTSSSIICSVSTSWDLRNLFIMF